MPTKSSSKKKGLTKSQMASEISDKSGLSKVDVNNVLTAMSDVIASELKSGRPTGVPGLVKISLNRKPATPSRQGINPFTKEAITIKAKPARNVVKVRAVKALKEMV